MSYAHPITPNARRRGLRLAAVAAAGAGLTLSACSSSAKQPPASAVDSSVSQLGSASSLSLQLSLGITPDQAQQISSKSGSSLTAAEAKALSSGSIFFTTQTGHGEALDSNQALTDSSDAYDLGLQFGSQVPFELKYVSQNLYVRADLNQLLTDVGQDPSQAASFQKDLATINTMVPGISDLGTSKWVEVSHSSLVSLGALLKQAESSSGQNQPSSAQLQSTLASLRNSALSSLKANTTYASIPSQNGRTGYSATVDVHGFLASFGPALQKDLSSVPMVGSKYSSDFTKLQDKVPAGQKATADLYTSGGRLSEVDVDLNQFASDKMSFAVPLKVAFTAPPSISTPTGATNLDLSQLPQLLQNLTSGGLGSSGSSSSSSQ